MKFQLSSFPSAPTGRLSRAGLAFGVMAMALLAADALLWREGAGRLAQVSALTRQVAAGQDALANAQAADARYQQDQAQQEAEAAQRAELLAPLLTLQNANPAAVAIEAAAAANVRLTSVHTDRRMAVQVHDGRLEATDVHVELTAPLDPSVWFLEQMGQTAQQRLFLRGLSLSRTSQGWKTSLTYRTFRPASP